MAFINATGNTAATSFNKGNPLYITLLTMVAALGGLLFGYDTAVVNGAEKSLVAFYIQNITDASHHQYAVSMVTQYRTLMIVVLFIVFIIISLQIIRLTGMKKGGITGLIILAIVAFWSVRFCGKCGPI